MYQRAAATGAPDADAAPRRGWFDDVFACVLPAGDPDDDPSPPPAFGESLGPCGCDSTRDDNDATPQSPPPATAAPGSARVVVLGPQGCGKLELIRAWRRYDRATAYESARHGARFTHVALGGAGHVVLNALDACDLASPTLSPDAQTFDEATAHEVRVASAHARLSSAEGVAVVVDVAAYDEGALRHWVRAVRAAHAAAAVVLIANKWGLARKRAPEAALVARASTLAQQLDVDAWFPGLGDAASEVASDADLAPLRYLLDDVLMRRRVFAAHVARARKESRDPMRGAGAGMAAYGLALK